MSRKFARHPQPPGREIISSPEVVNQNNNNAHLADDDDFPSNKNNPAGPALLMMNLRCVLVLDMI
jgi:hypothetical protein